jgi:hypothetical protein
MTLKPANYCVRVLIAAAFMLAASSTYSQTANPFTKFGGNWVGGGFIYLSNGTKERIRCRAGFIPADMFNIVSLKLEIRCAGDSYKFELQSELNHNGGSVSGTWSEDTRGMNGIINGRINGDQIAANVESATFNALFELVNQGEKQTVRIQSPGSEITDVLIGLNRSGSRPTANAPTANAPIANAPTANAPTANAPTANVPTANVPTGSIPTGSNP